MPMNGEQVRNALNKVGTGGRGEVEALHAILMDLYLKHDHQQAAIVALAREAKKLRAATEELVRRAIGQSAAESGAPDAAPVAEAAPPPRGGVRIGADGNPLSPDQAAAEEVMDAAIAAGGSAPAASAAPPSSDLIPRRGNLTSVPAPQGAGTRIGADGTPVSPEQEAVEQLMDAAAGPRP